jgi:hypothetical protein
VPPALMGQDAQACPASGPAWCEHPFASQVPSGSPYSPDRRDGLSAAFTSLPSLRRGPNNKRAYRPDQQLEPLFEQVRWPEPVSAESKEPPACSHGD